MELKETSFISWRFSEEEMVAARQISQEHRMYLQTLLSDAAESKLALKLDPYRPLIFTQEEAYTRGQMDILAMLLNDETISLPKNAVPEPLKPQE
jgi:hypothetical protein